MSPTLERRTTSVKPVFQEFSLRSIDEVRALIRESVHQSIGISETSGGILVYQEPLELIMPGFPTELLHYGTVIKPQDKTFRFCLQSRNPIRVDVEYCYVNRILLSLPIEGILHVRKYTVMC